MQSTHGAGSEGGQARHALATSRPWISAAGCLGGGALAVVLGCMVVIAAVVVAVFFPEVFGGGDKPAKAQFLAALGQLEQAPALRVATRVVNVRVDASVPTEATLRPWLIPVGPGFRGEVGRTRVELVAEGNRVQYVIPLGEPSRPGEPPIERRFEGEGDALTLVLTLPPPRVDETVVDIQSDPAKLKLQVDRDWVDHVVGDDRARDLALSRIREAVVRMASSETAMFEVREKSREVVATMLRELLPEELRGRRIVVRWSDDPPAEARAGD
ncbi:MAG: hypothetical protein ACKOYN_02805 [Planctomycetota bacterium]